MIRKSILAVWLAAVLALTACTTQAPVKPAATEATVTEAQAPSGANETAYPITVKDGLGNEVTLEKAPERIVSLAPNVTEVLFALGLGDKVVGTSEFSDFPQEAATIETVGGANGFDFERIAELTPDLVITNGMIQGLAEPMAGAKIAVAGYYPQSMDQVIEQISQVAELTNTQAIGAEIVQDMKDRRAAVATSVSGLPQPTVFYEVWGDPLMVAGKGSFISEIIELAGGEDVAADSEPYSNYDIEQLVTKNPQIYLINDGDPNLNKDALAQRPGYADLDAIKNDKVLTVSADLISRPGPRLIEGLEQVADLLHPDRKK